MARTYFHYDPSLAAAALFVALFGITSIVHTYQLVKSRTWYFIPFLVGCLGKIPPLLFFETILDHIFTTPSSYVEPHYLQTSITVETIGYAGRVVNAKQTPDWELTPYIIQTLLILLGPPFFAASIYMILGRIIRLLEADKHSIIRTTWMTKIFVFGDVLSILVQGFGKD